MAMDTKSKLEGPELKKAYAKLSVYTALGNRMRLRAFFMIAKNQGVSFRQICRELKVEKAHVAVELAILHAGGLVRFTTERKGKAVSSSYFLTDRGKQELKELQEHVPGIP